MPFRANTILLFVIFAPACLFWLPPPRPSLQGTVLKGTKPFPWARIYILASPEPASFDTRAASLIQDDMGKIDMRSGTSQGLRYVSADGQGRFALQQTLRGTPD